LSAETMASSSGRLTAAPTPRRNVRRGRAFLVMNIDAVSSIPGFLCVSGLTGLQTLPKRCARRNPQDQRRKPVIVRGCLTNDRPDGGHIVIIEPPSQPVR